MGLMKKFISVGLALFLATQGIGVPANDQLVAGLLTFNLPKIRKAVAAGADVDAVSIDGESQNPILFVWGRSQSLFTMECLLDCGADPNYTDDEGHTLLMYASGCRPQEYGGVFAAQKLRTSDYIPLFLDWGADIHAVDHQGWTAIDYSVTLLFDSTALMHLLDYGGQVTKQTIEIAMDKTYERNRYDYRKIRLLVDTLRAQTPDVGLSEIVTNAIQGNSGAVCSLLESGSQLEADEEQLVLFYTAAFGSVDALQYLLNTFELSHEALDPSKLSLLEVAAAGGNTDAVEYLAETFEWDDSVLQKALRRAANNDHTAAVDFLLRHGVTFEMPIDPWNNQNVLLTPAENNSIESIKLLIQYGYPVNNETAWYAMKYAARGGAIDVLRYFYELGYDIDYKADITDIDSSVLRDACAFGQLEIVKYAVEHGANVNAAQKCLPIVVERGDVELARYLLSQGADPDGRTEHDDGSQGDSAREIAERYGLEAILALF